VHNAAHQVVPGATVYGTWTTAPSSPPRAVSGITDANGQCSFEVVLGKKYYAADLAVTAVSPPPGPVYYYDSALNHDPDGESNGTDIVVRPP
jgi:hypothetical protein